MIGRTFGFAGSAAIALTLAFAPSIYAAPGGSERVTEGGSASERCTRLKDAVIGGARIQSAKYVAAGEKLPIVNLPVSSGICQVRARVSGAPTSTIQVEVWLPDAWNAKLLGQGGSGFSGGLPLAPLTFAKPALDGYATMATDAGHEVAEPPLWALKQPERIADFGYRANHLGTVVAKRLIERYYGASAKRTYFRGCSNGGRDALMLAQRFPKDYDGIIAGAPANNYVSLMVNFANYRSLIERLPPDGLTPKMSALHDAALKACDAADGVKDGLIAAPRSCRFDPAVLSCRPGHESKSCLSPIELDTVRSIYAGTRAQNGRLIHPGPAVGSEYMWPQWITGPKATGGAFSPYFFGYFVHDDPTWTMNRFDVDRDWTAARAKLSGALDATDPDLRPFVANGGKLLMYHGWDDQAISSENTIAYFDHATRKLGARSGDIRLFMVPGMGHCFDGKGFTTADFVAEMDRWVEKDVAPERIVGERPANPLLAIAGMTGNPTMTRPLCAWPRVAKYTGRGSSSKEGSYVCR